MKTMTSEVSVTRPNVPYDSKHEVVEGVGEMKRAFAEQLKHWRSVRRMSQLDLGLAANVSARHVSFLETGRAAPSRAMVLQLCETLEVPLPAQNTVLQAAGFAEVFLNRGLNNAELAHVREAVDWTLKQHNPYPAMALDKHWTIIKANAAASMLLNAVGLQDGDSLLTAMQQSQQLRAAIGNWDQVVRHMVSRLRMESVKLGHDPVLREAAENLAKQLGDGGKSELHESTAVLSTRYVLNGVELSLFSMIAQFGSAEDIALADLKIELMFPADEKTKAFLERC
jgi:transcriptional regulator with XRE-family HTH domain